MLAGRKIVVIGASTGIGAAALRRFATYGADVLGVARSTETGAALADELCAEGLKARFRRADITSEREVVDLFAWMAGEWGRPDGALNNAAMTQDALPIDATPTAVFDALFAVNVRGTWLCLREEMALMAGHGGSIVNVASIAGQRGFPGLSVYTASKHAVLGMTKSAALDGAARGVRVNCLCPGTTRTRMMEQQMATRPGGLEGTIARIPLGRLSDPVEQAEAAAWLLSDRATFVTGEALTVDGGATIR
jgi:NAD(P)-dependent dehydrogenase (short-subunit alcohol dehydrogenase family)